MQQGYGGAESRCGPGPGPSSGPVSPTKTSRCPRAPAARPRSKKCTRRRPLPGSARSPTYLHANASAAIDTRPVTRICEARHACTSSRITRYDDRDDTYTFDRLDAEIVQHIPILRENWVLSLRGRLQTTLSDDGRRAVFPAAVARQRQLAARLQQLALPRSAQPALLRRIPLDAQPAGDGRGHLLRCRHRRRSLRRAQHRPT